MRVFRPVSAIVAGGQSAKNFLECRDLAFPFSRNSFDQLWESGGGAFRKRQHINNQVSQRREFERCVFGLDFQFSHCHANAVGDVRQHARAAHLSPASRKIGLQFVRASQQIFSTYSFSQIVFMQMLLSFNRVLVSASIKSLNSVSVAGSCPYQTCSNALVITENVG